MRIEELKLKFPTVKFYKLAVKPKLEFLQLDNVEDLIEVTSQIAYFENEVDAELATEINTGAVLDTYSSSLSYIEKSKFESFCYENMAEKLEKLCAIDGYTTIQLYGISENVSYCETGPSLNQADLEKVWKELDRVYGIFLKEQERAEEQKNKAIDELIDSYKEKYSDATTKAGKDELIQEVQMWLKEKFQMDGRSDHKASKAYLKVRLGS